MFYKICCFSGHDFPHFLVSSKAKDEYKTDSKWSVNELNPIYHQVIWKTVKILGLGLRIFEKQQPKTKE